MSSNRIDLPGCPSRRSAWLIALGLIAVGCSSGNQAGGRTVDSAVPAPVTSEPSASTSLPQPAITATITTTVSTAAEPPTTIPDECTGLTDTTLTVEVDGTERVVEVAVPARMSAAAPAPLLILLHGFNGAAQRILDITNLGVLAPGAGVVVASAQGIGEPATWHYNPADDMGDAEFLDAISEQLMSSPCIDADNVWLAGFSAGSGYAGIFGCSRPERFAGLVMVSGLPPALCPADSGIEIVIFHGVDDPVVPFDGGQQTVGSGAVELVSVPESSAGWAAQAGCASEQQMDVYGEQNRSLVATWDGCAGDSTVTLVAIEGLGHAWPSSAGSSPPIVDASCVAVAAITGVADPVASCFG